jgi:hypothetical protein
MYYAHNPSRKRSEQPRHRLPDFCVPYRLCLLVDLIPREVTAGVFMSWRFNSMRCWCLSFSSCLLLADKVEIAKLPLLRRRRPQLLL